MVRAAGPQPSTRFLEFFVSHIRDANTRRAYGRAVGDFMTWCADAGVPSIALVQPLHVAARVEMLSASHSAPTAKQRLAAVRMLYDWLVVKQVVPVNPAASVRGPSHSVKRGKTPVLDPSEARSLLDAIDCTTIVGLRDRALIGLMVYSFARIGAVTGMKVEDVCTQSRRLWVRLNEKGGERHEMPCHHNLEEYLHAYIDAAGIADDTKDALFRTDRPVHENAVQAPNAPGQCLLYGAASRHGGRNWHQDRQPHLSRDWHHGLPQKWRYARAGRHDGKA
ncbi:tyrosine-type recombinase/integrase [Devosia sp. UYZn731]|uniref:tyrosine-type recombinase/integrase n=1 Tax=Devosia sp. UYZn731 TaxID=3156345 RepID=UPI0033949A02